MQIPKGKNVSHSDHTEAKEFAIVFVEDLPIKLPYVNTKRSKQRIFNWFLFHRRISQQRKEEKRTTVMVLLHDFVSVSLLLLALFSFAHAHEDHDSAMHASAHNKE